MVPAVPAPLVMTPPPAVPASALGTVHVLSAAPVLAPTPATVSAPTPAPASLTPAPPASGAPPPIVDTHNFGYLVGSIEVELSAHAKAKARGPAAASGSARVAAAVAGPPVQTPARRNRRTVIDRGYRYEYLPTGTDLSSELSTSTENQCAPSDRGTGPMGFAGTGCKPALPEAAGLTTLPGNEFDTGPTLPMTPGSWDGELATREID